MKNIERARYYFYSINGISLAELAEVLPGSTEDKWSELLNYLWSCQVANCIHTSDNFEKSQLPTGHFYLSATKVQNLIGKNKAPFYNAYLKTLDDLNIVKMVSESYLAGEYCRIYRFTKQQMDRGFLHTQLANARLVKKAIKQADRDAVEETSNFEDVHHDLRMMVHKIAIPEYETILTQIDKFKDVDTIDDKKYRLEAYKMVCKSLNEGTYKHRVTLSSNNRRLSSVISTMMKAVRRGMRFNDDLQTPLIEKDASNSQFWVFTVLNNPKVLGHIRKYYPQFADLIIITMEHLECQPNYQRFKQDALKGRIYEILLTVYNEEAIKRFEFEKKYNDGMDKTPRLTLRDRNYIKSKVMLILFDEKKQTGKVYETNKGRKYVAETSHYRNCFEIAYPEVDKALNIFRMSMTASTFACMMQSVEAFIWLEGLAALLIDQGFEDFVTVHDCFMIKNKPYVIEQFNTACDYYFANILKSEKPKIK